MAIATVDGGGGKFVLGPDHGGMAGRFFVTLDAGIKGIAAFELDGNNVALGVIMGALRALVYFGAVADDGLSDFHFNESNRSSWRTPFTLLNR